MFQKETNTICFWLSPVRAQMEPATWFNGMVDVTRTLPQNDKRRRRGFTQMTDSPTPAGQPTRRKNPRFPITCEAVLRRSAHATYSVNVRDISQSGCKLEVIERPALNEIVWLKFDGLEALEARVCWVDGFVAGLQFEKDIHPAVFEMRLRRLGR